jgi:hypothetical protein
MDRHSVGGLDSVLMAAKVCEGTYQMPGSGGSSMFA